MSKPVSVEVTYVCDTCGDTFAVMDPLEPSTTSLMMRLGADHEDCPEG